MNARGLRKQLRDLGASASESEQLSRLAQQLSVQDLPKLSSKTRAEIANIPGKRWQIHIYKFAAGGIAAMFIGVLFFAQSALPGSWLYGVKRGGEKIRAIIQPDYTETLIDKRSDEIEQLKQNEAAPEKLEQAKQEYQRAIEVYEQHKEPQEQQNKDQDRTLERRERTIRSWWENQRRNNFLDDRRIRR